MIKLPRSISHLLDEGDLAGWLNKGDLVHCTIVKIRETGDGREMLVSDDATGETYWKPLNELAPHLDIVWYLHPESDCLFLDKPNETHDGLSVPVTIDEAFEHASNGAAISALHKAILYALLSEGY